MMTGYSNVAMRELSDKIDHKNVLNELMFADEVKNSSLEHA